MLERVYTRLSWRYVYLVLGAAVFVSYALVSAAGAMLMGGYLNQPDSYWEIVPRFWVFAGIAYVLGLALTWRRIKLVTDHVRDPAGPVTAEAAWTSAVFTPIRTVTTVLAIGAVFAIPFIVPVAIRIYDLDTWGATGFIIAGTAGTLTCAVISMFVAELLMRPVVTDLAAQLPAGWRPPRSAWSVRAKLATLFFNVAIAAGLGVGSFVPPTSSPIELVAWTAVIGTAFAGLFIFPITFVSLNALIAPLRALRDGTERVARGDYSTPVSQTTADELGEVVTGFNRLQDRVREQLDELRASRVRVIAASDAERRRVERNLHDGAQQRLVALALKLRMLEEAAEADPALAELAGSAASDLSAALEELRDLARGLHPQVLSTGGLGPALNQLAGRAPVPVVVEAPADRFAEAVESTAYFVAAEALANISKYAQASSASIRVEQAQDRLRIEISDNGVGGADPGAGSGLTGLSDRLAAVEGRLEMESPVGAGTTVRAEIPLP